MKILLATDSSGVNNYFAIKFIENGIEPSKTIKNDNIADIIEKHDIQILLFDLDSENYNNIETAKSLKDKFKDLTIIILTLKTGVDFVMEISSVGVFGIISKIDDLDTQFANAIAIIDNLQARRDEKRRHIRVKPLLSKHNIFKLAIKGLDSEYHGLIKDISRGGAAITFSKPPPESLFFKGKEIQIQIELSAMRITSKGVVVVRSGMDAAILFQEMAEGYKKRLFEYILSRIDSEE
ncbi:MAG: PilZ domain-containing protein [Spirochaetota bacterium]|nr:PilZ domain-containing protein [Spirochaetota bacterium]